MSDVELTAEEIEAGASVVIDSAMRNYMPRTVALRIAEAVIRHDRSNGPDAVLSRLVESLTRDNATLRATDPDWSIAYAWRTERDAYRGGWDASTLALRETEDERNRWMDRANKAERQLATRDAQTERLIRTLAERDAELAQVENDRAELTAERDALAAQLATETEAHRITRGLYGDAYTISVRLTKERDHAIQLCDVARNARDALNAGVDDARKAWAQLGIRRTEADSLIIVSGPKEREAFEALNTVPRFGSVGSLGHFGHAIPFAYPCSHSFGPPAEAHGIVSPLAGGERRADWCGCAGRSRGLWWEE